MYLLWLKSVDFYTLYTVFRNSFQHNIRNITCTASENPGELFLRFTGILLWLK